MTTLQYPDHLIDTANKIKTLSNGRLVQLFTKAHPELVDTIITHTTFLSPNTVLSARCYCVLNNIHEPLTCRCCNNLVKWSNGSFRIYCSNKCKQSDPTIKEKTRQTILNRYGVDNPSKLDEVKHKKRITCLANHGVEYPQQSQHILQKSYNTTIEHHGVRRPLQKYDILTATKLTNLARYGHENIAQGILKTKIKETMLTKYGDHSSRSDIVKQKIKHTKSIKYTRDNPYKQQMLMGDKFDKLTDFDWLVHQYVTLGKTATQISTELNVAGTTVVKYLKRMEISIRLTCNTSYKSLLWLKSVEMFHGITIQHALNGGEYRIPGTRYKADGFCAETNTIYEFYGDYWHGNPTKFNPYRLNVSTGKTMGELYYSTMEREQKIISLGYNLLVMWESDWDKN